MTPILKVDVVDCERGNSLVASQEIDEVIEGRVTPESKALESWYMNLRKEKRPVNTPEIDISECQIRYIVTIQSLDTPVKERLGEEDDRVDLEHFDSAFGREGSREGGANCIIGGSNKLVDR